MKRLAVLIALLGVLTPLAAGELKYTAKLPGWYTRPQFTQPHPRSTAMEYVDVGVLAAALSAASYFALKRRSRRGLFGVMIFSLLYFGFYRQGCVCAIGAIQNVTTAVFDTSYAIPLFVLAFFLLPLAFTLLFGRTFCAGVCPLGAVQDLVAFYPVRVPRWLEGVLGLGAWAYLGLAVLFAATGSAYIICEYDPFVGFFRLSATLPMLIFGGIVLLIGVFIARPYCRYACPLGAIFRLCAMASKHHATVTPDECIRCRLCEGSCPYGAIREANDDTPAPPRSEGKRRLAVLLVLGPVLIALATYFGTYLGGPFARMHWKVRLADRVRAEEAGEVTGTTEASLAFRQSRDPIDALYSEAAEMQDRFVWASAIFGGFLGLVAWAKMLSLSVRRTRGDYLPDRATCLSCGRCFDYCPVQRSAGEQRVVRQEALAGRTS